MGFVFALKLIKYHNVSYSACAQWRGYSDGLTPSQYSSADKVRMGRITGIGKNSVRTALVESCWWLISKDKEMARRYKRIKARAGAKCAIVAVARQLLLRIRRMLLDVQPYRFKQIT